MKAPHMLLLDCAIRTYNNQIRNRQSLQESRNDNRAVGSFLDRSISLDKNEKELISQKWGSLISNLKRGYDFYRGLKAISGFNADYLPASYFYPYIESILNPSRWKYNLRHKSLFEMAFSEGINHPVTVVRSFGGMLFDSSYRPITADEAALKVASSSQPLLFKPSTDTCQGSGIALHHPDKLRDLAMRIKNGEILSKYGDFVLQELVEQSEETAIYNPSSLNCMRITTLNLNDRISVCSRAIKCGPKDSVVDNIGSGKRGVIVGIHPDGTLCDKGFYGNGEWATEHNGVTFTDKKIRHFHRVVDAALQLHRYVPQCKIIGWDIALDSTETPVLIEGNFEYPGITMEQMCSGPIFGERTDEVISFCKSHI